MAFNKRMTALVGLIAAFALVVAVAGVPYMTSDLLMAQGSFPGAGGNESPQTGVVAGGSVQGGAFVPSGANVLADKTQLALPGGLLYFTPGGSTGITYPAGTYDVFATFTDASGQVWYLIFNGVLIWVQG